MDTKFVMFKRSHTNKPVLINVDHVRTAFEKWLGSGQAGHGFGGGRKDYPRGGWRPQIRLGEVGTNPTRGSDRNIVHEISRLY